jgi:CRISPR-associated protein Csh2
MKTMAINSGEILFIKSVKDGIPNRDPLNDSDARRLFPEEDGRISLSDVSIKRDVRDYVVACYPGGGPQQRNHVFVQQIMNDKGGLLGRRGLAGEIAKKAGKEKQAKEDMKEVLVEHCFDVRTFGIVYSVKPKFNLTGPVQFGWAHSLHPVDSHYVQGTVVMPSTEAGADTSEGDEAGKTQGTIWTSYIVPFAVFAMPAVINAKASEFSGMSHEDQELLLRALWQGTQHRQARGRGIQQPLFLLHVEYKDPFYRIGYLEEMVRLPNRAPAGISDVELDVEEILKVLQDNAAKISRVRVWTHPMVSVKGDTKQYLQQLW